MKMSLCAAIAGFALAAAAHGYAQTPAPTAGGQAVSKRPMTLKGPRQLKPMFVDEKLFTPSKWWKYEGFDDDRLPEYGVEQHGLANIGVVGERHGAHVTYRVDELRTPAEAHRWYVQLNRYVKPSRNFKVVRKPSKHGDESVEIIAQLLDKNGQVVEYHHKLFARYGKFGVELDADANMKQFGPRAASGDRPWLCDQVFQPVSREALAKWDRYRTLLADAR